MKPGFYWYKDSTVVEVMEGGTFFIPGSDAEYNITEKDEFGGRILSPDEQENQLFGSPVLVESLTHLDQLTNDPNVFFRIEGPDMTPFGVDILDSKFIELFELIDKKALFAFPLKS